MQPLRVSVENCISDHPPSLYSAKPVSEEAAVRNWAELDDAAAARYRCDGFLLVRGGFTADEVAGAVADLDGIIHSEAPRVESLAFEGSVREVVGGAGVANSDAEAGPGISEVLLSLPAVERAPYVRKAMGFAHDMHPALLHMASKEALVSAVRLLAGGEPCRLLQDMALIKPPGGREKPWHQDHAYFRVPLETPIVGVWIALGRVTEESGAMVLLPGHHADGPRLHASVRDFQLCDGDMEACAADRVVAPMDAGDVLLFDGKLPHGTDTNRTASGRWAVQLHYIPTDVAAMDEATDEATGRAPAFGAGARHVSC